MSTSLIKSDFYDSHFTFGWQGFWITTYYGAFLLSGWLFAYRYLNVSRTLYFSVWRKKDEEAAEE